MFKFPAFKYVTIQSCKSSCHRKLFLDDRGHHRYQLPESTGIWKPHVCHSQKMFSLLLRGMAFLKRSLGHNSKSLTIILTLFALISQSIGIGEVIWAVNAGGEAHTDVHGIVYEADPLEQDKVGISSDYGKTLMIGRVNPQDQILYQTERYHMSNFGYEIPIKGSGDFTLVLKFCEVWFTSPNKKVFHNK